MVKCNEFVFNNGLSYKHYHLMCKHITILHKITFSIPNIIARHDCLFKQEEVFPHATRVKLIKYRIPIIVEFPEMS